MRYIAVKEEHAELAKKELRILWGDYFRPEHLEQHPNLHSLFFTAMKQGLRRAAERQHGQRAGRWSRRCRRSLRFSGQPRARKRRGSLRDRPQVGRLSIRRKRQIHTSRS